MRKKVLVVLGHPDSESFCAALARSYAEGAMASGAEVTSIDISGLKFDPVLHKGYRVIQELEPDLVMVQEKIKGADHIVFVYPTWWGAMPALLKGLLERMMLPGFAYRFHDSGMGWDKHLRGKSARIIVTMNSPVLAYKLFFGSVGDKLLKTAILSFCGISPVRFTHIGSVEKISKGRLAEWISKIGALGRALK